MKLNKVIISLTDFVYTDKLDSFFNELGGMKYDFISPDWKKLPVAIGRQSEIILPEFNKLDFVSKGKVILNQFQNFTTAVAITIEIELMPEVLKTFEKNSNSQKNNKLLKSYEKDIWEFWKLKITTTTLLNRESYLGPVSLIHLYLSTDEYKQFSLDVENAYNCQQTEPVKLLVSRFGANDEGLISILGHTDQTLSIVCQHSAILSSNGFDFSGIMFFDIRSESWEEHASPHYYKIAYFQQYRFWLTIRDKQIILWKDKIEHMSKMIKEFEKNFSDVNKNKEFPLFHEKSSFLIEYSSLIDEYRYLQRIVGTQLTHSEDSWHGEHYIVSEFLDLNGHHYGILKGISQEIIESAEKLKDEFEVIKEQYKILGEELSELMNFVNAKQNLNLAKNNEKVQKTIS